jgi:mutator protein MutT
LAARAVVIDENDRLLLFRFRNPGDRDEFWAMPGGGVEPGETHDEAVRRELREEVGIDAPELGAVVWIRRQVFEFGGRRIDQPERYYFVRVKADAVRPGTSVDLAKENIVAHRWWMLEELDSTEETIWPARLAELTRTLLAEGPPPEPLDIGA